MSKHTPGPWKTCKANDSHCPCGLIWSIPADVVVAQLSNEEGSPQRTSDEGAANAALIAAAPDMLMELETLLAVHRRKVHNKLSRGDKPAADLAQSHVDRISELIARANGV